MIKAILLFLCASCFAFSLQAQWIWDRNKLKEIKREIQSFTYANAYRQLKDDAERAMEAPAYSVTFKQKPAPGKDPHDYVSLSLILQMKMDFLTYIAMANPIRNWRTMTVSPWGRWQKMSQHCLWPGIIAVKSAMPVGQ